MMTISKFSIEDYHGMKPATQLGDDFGATAEDLNLIASKNEHFYTVRVDGRVLACAGAVEYWQGRAEVFVIFDEFCKHEFLIISRALRTLISWLPYRRLEATVCKAYEQGHRLARLMGFHMEAETLKAYSPTGADYSLYVRVK